MTIELVGWFVLIVVQVFIPTSDRGNEFKLFFLRVLRAFVV